MTNDDDPPISTRKLTTPTRLHKALGILTLSIFVVLIFIDASPDYTVSPTLAGLLVITYLTFLGFGHRVGQLLGLYGRQGGSK